MNTLSNILTEAEGIKGAGELSRISQTQPAKRVQTEKYIEKSGFKTKGDFKLQVNENAEALCLAGCSTATHAGYHLR